LKGWLLPGHIDTSEVDAPDNNVLAVSRDSLSSKIDLEISCLADEISAAADSVGDPRNQRARFRAVTRLGGTGGCGVCDSNSVICEDATAVEIVGTRARSHNLSPEPVIACGLVGCEDDIVPLANSEENPASDEGLDWNQIGGDDAERVVVEGDTNIVVHAGVDETQAVLLTLRDLGVAVRASGTGLVLVLPLIMIVSAGGGGEPFCKLL